MQICCTKKLQEATGIQLQNNIEEEDIFCWSAHLVTINRRKALVAVNDSNRFGFVLYGVKAKDFKDFEDLISYGILSCLRDEKINDQIICHYLESAGEITFTKTRGPRYVARLNKACERVGFFEDKLHLDSLFQTMATRNMNKDLIKISNESDYDYPYKLLYKDLAEYYEEPLIECVGVSLMIKLDLGNTYAWRRVTTPVDITFKQLHEIIQVVFGWKNQHLYEFDVLDEEGTCILNMVSEYEEIEESSGDYEKMVDSEVRFLDCASEDYTIYYSYDYGEDWVHEIVIQDVDAEYDKNYPVCIMGENNAPPENVGGIHGFKEFLKIMGDPKHPEHEDVKQWAEDQEYTSFNIEGVNRELEDILRK